MLRVLSAFILLLSLGYAYAAPNDTPPASEEPLDPRIVTDADIIGESTWSEGDDVILEREYYLKDGQNEIYAKRRFKVLPDGKLELIWRSPEAADLDERVCAFQGGKPIVPGPDSRVTYSADVTYSVSCELPKMERKSSGLDVTPQDIVIGDQYLKWSNGNHSADAGSNAFFQMSIGYRFHGAGQVWFVSNAEAARDPNSCVVSVSRTYSGQGTHEAVLTDTRRCWVKNEPGTYPINIEGCAGSLCDTQVFFTQLVDG